MTNEGEKFHFDTLYLFPNTKVGLPLKASLLDNMTIPQNYCHINSSLDLLLFYYKMKILKAKIFEDLLPPESIPIIIYGNCMELHGCIYFMLAIGINPKTIHIVLTRNKNEQEGCPDEFVESFLLSYEKELGIHIYEKHEFLRWNIQEHVGKSGFYITTLMFRTKLTCFTIHCGLFVSFCSRSADPEFMKVLFQYGLATWNDKLLINRNGETNCPDIKAAGPITHYHEAIASPKFNHRYYCDEEVGAWVSFKL